MTATIVVFLDDDAAAEPGWLALLLAPYADPSVTAVGVRLFLVVHGPAPTGHAFGVTSDRPGIA